MGRLSRSWIFFFAIWPTLAGAVTLAPGDAVVAGRTEASNPASEGLYRVDPVTRTSALISAGEFADFSLLGTNTIYALSGDEVVAIDAASGASHVVSSGGMLVSPSGIAVHESGRLFVSDYGALGGDGAIFEIDPSTGSQSILRSGGFMPAFHSNALTDLEMLPGGDLIILDPEGSAVTGDVWRIDWITGAATLLFDDPLALYTAGTTGLGVAPNGDVYVSDGLSMNSYVLKIDAITAVTTVAGDITVPAPFFLDLPGTDIAIGADGTGFMSATARGVFTWNGSPQDIDGIGFVNGSFNEVQIVVPEPASALLCALGVAWLGARARRARR